MDGSFVLLNSVTVDLCACAYSRSSYQPQLYQAQHSTVDSRYAPPTQRQRLIDPSAHAHACVRKANKREWYRDGDALQDLVLSCKHTIPTWPCIANVEDALTLVDGRTLNLPPPSHCPSHTIYVPYICSRSESPQRSSFDAFACSTFIGAPSFLDELAASTYKEGRGEGVRE